MNRGMNHNNLPGGSATIQVMEPFEKFFKEFVESTYPLFGATVIAILWANLSPDSYHHVSLYIGSLLFIASSARQLPFPLARNFEFRFKMLTIWVS